MGQKKKVPKLRGTTKKGAKLCETRRTGVKLQKGRGRVLWDKRKGAKLFGATEQGRNLVGPKFEGVGGHECAQMLGLERVWKQCFFQHGKK